jgi:hypothetical protein
VNQTNFFVSPDLFRQMNITWWASCVLRLSKVQVQVALANRPFTVHVKPPFLPPATVPWCAACCSIVCLVLHASAYD